MAKCSDLTELSCKYIGVSYIIYYIFMYSFKNAYFDHILDSQRSCKHSIHTSPCPLPLIPTTCGTRTMIRPGN